LFDLAVIFGFPFLIAASGIAYAAFRTYLKHKERMAMIEKGLIPPDWEKEDDGPHINLQGHGGPVVVTLVGVAITLGLLTIGIGPWLLGGLIPTAIGCALLINQMIKESKESKQDKKDHS